jgi:hypothetical protein
MVFQGIQPLLRMVLPVMTQRNASGQFQESGQHADSVCNRWRESTLQLSLPEILPSGRHTAFGISGIQQTLLRMVLW